MYRTAVNLYLQLRPNAKEPNRDHVRNSIFVKATLASTAYQIVHKVVRSHPLELLKDSDVYQAMRYSYYGGIT